jgi:hypothetical protein
VHLVGDQIKVVQLLSETFIILRRIERDMTMNVEYIGLHIKYSLLLRDFNET